MFQLTNNEAKVLAIFAAVLFFGTAFNILSKKYPSLRNSDRFNTEYVPRKIDINTAGKEELKSVPYIGEYTATAIIEFRNTHGPFENIEQLKRVRGIREGNFKRFALYLKAGRR